MSWLHALPVITLKRISAIRNLKLSIGRIAHTLLKSEHGNNQSGRQHNRNNPSSLRQRSNHRKACHSKNVQSGQFMEGRSGRCCWWSQNDLRRAMRHWQNRRRVWRTDSMHFQSSSFNKSTQTRANHTAQRIKSVEDKTLQSPKPSWKTARESAQLQRSNQRNTLHFTNDQRRWSCHTSSHTQSDQIQCSSQRQP